MVEQLIRFCSLSLLLLLVWEEPIWTVDTTYINLTYIKFYLGISRWRFPNIVCFLGCLFVSLTPTNSVEKMIPFFEKKNTHFFFRMGFGWKPPTFSTWSLSLSLQAEDLGRQYRFPEKSPNNWSMSSKTTVWPEQQTSPNGTKKCLSNFAKPWGVSSLYLYAVYCVILACAILLADKTGQRRRVPRQRIRLKMWGSG